MTALDQQPDDTAVAVGLPAADVMAAIQGAGVTHAVTVPDTHQRTLLVALDRQDRIPVVRATTEADVFGICGGLWIAGHRPLAVIQQVGLFAGANALRGITYDLGLPLAILAGLYGRDTSRPVSASRRSSVRLCPPFLDALGIHSVIVEGPADAPLVEKTLTEAFAEPRTSVVLLGAPTR